MSKFTVAGQRVFEAIVTTYGADVARQIEDDVAALDSDDGIVDAFEAKRAVDAMAAFKGNVNAFHKFATPQQTVGGGGMRVYTVNRGFDEGTAIGKIVNGKRDGTWKIESNKGDVETGDYRNGVRQGLWVKKLANGTVIETTYADGMVALPQRVTKVELVKVTS